MTRPSHFFKLEYPSPAFDFSASSFFLAVRAFTMQALQMWPSPSFDLCHFEVSVLSHSLQVVPSTIVIAFRALL